MKTDLQQLFRLAREKLTRAIQNSSLAGVVNTTSFEELITDFPEINLDQFTALASAAACEKAAASTRVSILLDLDQPNGTQHGGVVSMVLELIPVRPPAIWNGWAPGLATAVINLADDFRESLAGTRSRINSLDPKHPLWPDDANFHIRWSIDSRIKVQMPSGRSGDSNVQLLSGRSADCILALGVIELLRRAKQIPPEHERSDQIEKWNEASWKGLSASAQVSETGRLEPVPAAPLERKLGAALQGGVDTVLARLGRAQAHLATAQAASSTDVIEVTSLGDAVLYLARRGEAPSVAKRRRRRNRLLLFVSVLLITLSILGWMIWHYSWVAYPSASVLRRRLASALIDQAPVPVHCDHVIAIPKLSKETWAKQVLPVLKGIRSSYALVIGGLEGTINDADQFALDGLDELKSLRSLALLGSGVNELPGLDQLHGLEQLIISQSCVKSVMFAADLPSLRVLVLDSPWLQAVPEEWRLPQAEVIVVHCNSPNSSIFTNCPKLRALAVCSEHIESFYVPEDSPHLEELVVGASSLRYWSQRRPLPSLQRLKIAAIPNLHLDYNDTEQLDLAAFPGLRELHVDGGTMKELKNLPSLSNLLELDVDHAPELQLPGIEQLIHLRKLQLQNSAKVRLTNVGSLTELLELDVSACDISGLTGIDRLKFAKSISLRSSAGSIPLLPPLTELKNLEYLSLDDEQNRTIPALGSLKQCTLHVGGEEVIDGRDGSIIKKEWGKQLKWHPDNNGDGRFEVGGDGFSDEFYSSGYRGTFQIGQVAFNVWGRKDPKWNPARESFPGGLELHWAADWEAILERRGIQIGYEFPPR